MCAGPRARETAAALGRCAASQQGVLSHGHHSALGAARPGPTQSVLCLSSGPGLWVGGQGCRGQTQARRWALEQGPGWEDPTHVPSARTQASSLLPWHSPGRCSSAEWPPALLFLRLFLTFWCLKINLKT